MAIQVLKSGKDPDQVKQIITCGRCKCSFSFQNEDIRSDREGSYVECPECKHFISAKRVVSVNTWSSEDFYNK